MASSFSTYGILLGARTGLVAGQTRLGLLSEQVASGIRSQELVDYTAPEAQNLVNLSSELASHESFVALAKNVKPRLEVYDLALGNVSDTATSVNSLIISFPNYNSEQNSAIQSQLQTAMRQIQDYLNERVGDRYLFAGSRYSAPPVGDITALPVPPTETAPYVVANPAVPSYDVDYDSSNPTAAVPAAWDDDTFYISVTQTLTPNIVSTDSAFQKLIMGVRQAYAATQDPSTYTSRMNTARQLISEAIPELRGVRAKLAGDTTTLATARERHETFLADINNQIQDVQGVDVTEVSVRLKALETSLQASFASTGVIANLTILDYLR